MEFTRINILIIATIVETTIYSHMNESERSSETK